MTRAGRPRAEKPKEIKYSIRMDAETEQKLKASSPRVVSRAGRLMNVSDSHSEKAQQPMEVRLEGKEIVCNFLHP